MAGITVKIKPKIKETLPTTTSTYSPSFRQNGLKLIHERLKNVLVESLITELEEAIWKRDYDERVDTKALNRRYCDSICIVLNAPQEIYPNKSVEDLLDLLFPDNSAKLLQAEAYRLAHGAKEIESVVKCSRCGGNTTVRQLQTRSSDEAMTEFYKCVGGKGRGSCGKTWKI